MIASSSRIVLDSVARHAGVTLAAPEGIVADDDIHCGACGVAIPCGGRFVVLRPDAGSFTDWQYLAVHGAPGGEFAVCPSCATLFTKAFQVYQTRAAAAVYSAEGAWMLSFDAERRWFLLTPPEPPFVAYIATTMGQHVAWRAPITTDKNLIRLAVGRTLLTINRPLLLEASDICRDLADAIRQEIKDTQGKAINLKPDHPFARLDRKMEDPEHGMIPPRFREWMRKTGRTNELAFLDGLGEGELWGLSVLNKAKHEDPIKTCIKDRLAAKRGE